MKTMAQELMDITGCPAEDVKKVELLMREKSPILGELSRRDFNKLARESYQVLQHIRTDQSEESAWLLRYVNENA